MNSITEWRWQVNELEDRLTEILQSEEWRLEKTEYEESRDYITSLTFVTVESYKEIGSETVAENFSKLVRDINLQI